MRPAVEVLLAGLRLALGSGDPDADRRRCARVEDWRSVVALARRHRVLTLFLKGLGADGGPLAGSGIEAVLRVRRPRWLRRRLRRVGAFEQATGCLDAAGIPCIVLKGLPLSQQLYGHPFARGAVDLDLLVSPRTFGAAERALREAGWRRVRPDFRETSVRHRWYGRFRHEHVLSRAGEALDLHRRLLSNPYYLDAPFERLYAHSVPRVVGTTRCRVLGDVDQVLYLTCHGAKSYWSQIKWLCDLAALVASAPPSRLERAALRARDEKLDHVLASALLLCRDAFHVETPPAAAAVLPAGSRRAELAARLAWRTWGERHVVRRARSAARWGQKLIMVFSKPTPRFVLHEVARPLIDPLNWTRIDSPEPGAPAPTESRRGR